MNHESPLTFLCLASYEKGHEFLREAHRQGVRVLLLTSLSLRGQAQFPWEAIDEVYYMPDTQKVWNRQDTLNAVSYLARTERIRRIVPLDDFDLEMAAFLREHLRTPGMGESETRYFRDKLAMRLRASQAGIRVPRFVHLLHHATVARFLEEVPSPWVLKPRSMAGAIGIKKLHRAEQLWALAEQLGDLQSHYVLEEFIPGEICHVDTVVYQGAIQFAIASQYGRPPLEVSHEGGIFTTRLLERGSAQEQELLAFNAALLNALGLRNGVSHSEYIRAAADGKLYFLETAARVGGAHIADMVEAATGVNLWREWAKVEVAQETGVYQPPQAGQDYAGLVISLARQEHPDTSAFTDPEIVWRMMKPHHVGFIVKSPRRERVEELLASYVTRISQDFHASAPPRERPTD